MLKIRSYLKFQKVWALILAFGLIVLISGCGSKTTENNASVNTQSKTDEHGSTTLIKLKVGSGIDPVYSPLFVGDKAGIFKANGLDVTITKFAVGTEGVTAITAGQEDAGASAPTAPLLNLDKGGQLVNVGTFSINPTTVKFVTRSSIKTPADLKGKKLGVTNGSSSQYSWGRYLKVHGINQNEVTFVNIAPPEMVPIMDRGEIDGFALWEPFPTKALATMGNKVHILADGSENNVFIARISLLFGKDFADRNPEVVKRMLKSLIEVNKFIKDKPDEAAEIVANEIKLDKSLVKQAIADSKFDPVMNNDVVQDYKDTAAWLKGMGKIKGEPDYKAYFRPEYLKELDPTAINLQ